jgi:hypothetical protein
VHGWEDLRGINLNCLPIGKWGYCQRLDNGSWMSRDVHVQVCEGLGVQFTRATHRNIYVYSYAAVERVMASITEDLEKKLRLQVNREKSKVACVSKVKFLGQRILAGGRLAIALEGLKRMRMRSSRTPVTIGELVWR